VHLSAGSRFPERELLRLFHGTCEAVCAMHAYRPGAPAAPLGVGDGEVLDRHGDTEDDGASVPLVSRQHAAQGEGVFDGDEPGAGAGQDGAPSGQAVPYAHRDLKPA
jgi:serine/threonine kinase 16